MSQLVPFYSHNGGSFLKLWTVEDCCTLRPHSYDELVTYLYVNLFSSVKSLKCFIILEVVNTANSKGNIVTTGMRNVAWLTIGWATPPHRLCTNMLMNMSWNI